MSSDNNYRATDAQGRWRHTFKTVVEEAKRANALAWHLGDVMLAEVGPPDGSKKARRRLRACLASIDERFDDPRIRKEARDLYLTAAAFPPERRHPELCWELHKAAGTPEIFNFIVAGHRKDPELSAKPLTVEFVAGIARLKARASS